MIVDSYAIIAVLADEPAADAVEAVLRAYPCRVPSTVLAETVDRAIRLHGVDVETVLVGVRRLGLLDAVAVSGSAADAAGRLRAKHYHRVRRTVSLADCIVAAVALDRGEPVATSDPHLLDLCAAEGIDVVALPQSDGSVWTSGEDQGGSPASP